MAESSIFYDPFANRKDDNPLNPNFDPLDKFDSKFLKDREAKKNGLRGSDSNNDDESQHEDQVGGGGQSILIIVGWTFFFPLWLCFVSRMTTLPTTTTLPLPLRSTCWTEFRATSWSRSTRPTCRRLRRSRTTRTTTKEEGRRIERTCPKGSRAPSRPDRSATRKSSPCRRWRLD